MLDIDVLIEPGANDALDVVSLADMKKHLRITHSKLDDVITDAIKEAVAFFDFSDGVLNRSVLSRRIVRYLRQYPSGHDWTCSVIQLPYAPVSAVVSIVTAAGSVTIDPATYQLTNTIVPAIIPTGVWPSITAGARAVAVTYDVGYDTYPPAIRRMVKIMAAHFIENPEATINEPRQMMINRKVEFGIAWDLARFRIPVSYDSWDE